MRASAGAIKAGRAYVELLADDSKLQQGLTRAQASLRGFGSSLQAIGLPLMAVGTAITGSLSLAVSSFTSVGDSLAKMSRRVGLSVETLSAFSHAANRGGMDVETLETGIRKMHQTLYDAGRGMGDAGRTLAALGLKASDLAALSPEDQFRKIADRLSQIQNPGTRAALAVDLFGKSGARLLPMLEDGAAGLDEIRERCERLGIIVTSTEAAGAEVLDDAFTDLRASAKAVAFSIGGALAPAVSGIVKEIIGIVVWVTHWVRENKDLLSSLGKIGVVLFAAGSGYMAVATAAKAAAIAMAIAKGMTGPKGWIELDVGAAAAAGAIYLIQRATSATNVAEFQKNVEKTSQTLKSGKGELGDFAAGLSDTASEFRKVKVATDSAGQSLRDYLQVGKTGGLKFDVAGELEAARAEQGDLALTYKALKERYDELTVAASEYFEKWPEGAKKPEAVTKYTIDELEVLRGKIKELMDEAMAKMSEAGLKVKVLEEIGKAPLGAIAGVKQGTREWAELLDDPLTKYRGLRTEIESLAKVVAAGLPAAERKAAFERMATAEKSAEVIKAAWEKVYGDLFEGKAPKMPSVSVVGQFGGAFARMLGTRTGEDRIARATESTAKDVRELRQQASAGQLVFAAP